MTRNLMIRLAAAGLFVLAAALVATTPATAGEVATDSKGVALNGYDPMSYVVFGNPMHGAPEHAFTWRGVTFLFATEANKSRFASNPKRFLPQHGGHCALAASQGRSVPGDPTVFKVVKGKVYLFENGSSLQAWEKGPGAGLTARS